VQEQALVLLLLALALCWSRAPANMLAVLTLRATALPLLLTWLRPLLPRGSGLPDCRAVCRLLTAALHRSASGQ
jgi:hypothetical protein